MTYTDNDGDLGADCLASGAIIVHFCGCEAWDDK